MSRAVYYVGMVIGFVCMMTDHTLLGLGIMFLGFIINILTDAELSSYLSSSYNTPPKKEKKPYYKNEFEEYQHYKHCKRHMK